MPIDPEVIEMRYPGVIDFTDEDDTRLLQVAIGDAENEISELKWGKRYEWGVSALASHYVTRRKLAAEDDGGGGGGSFPVQSATADGVSATFAVPTNISPSEAHWYTTVYGTDYRGLGKLIFSGPHLVRLGNAAIATNGP